MRRFSTRLPGLGSKPLRRTRFAAVSSLSGFEPTGRVFALWWRAEVAGAAMSAQAARDSASSRSMRESYVRFPRIGRWPPDLVGAS